MTRETEVLLDLLRDARAHDRDLGAACKRELDYNVAALRRIRSLGRRCRTEAMRSMLELRAGRLVYRNRVVRRLAKRHGWTIPGDRRSEAARARWNAA